MLSGFCLLISQPQFQHLTPSLSASQSPLLDSQPPILKFSNLLALQLSYPVLPPTSVAHQLLFSQPLPSPSDLTFLLFLGYTWLSLPLSIPPDQASCTPCAQTCTQLLMKETEKGNDSDSTLIKPTPPTSCDHPGIRCFIPASQVSTSSHPEEGARVLLGSLV